MSEKIDTLKVGYPSEEDTDIGCLISEEAAIEVESQVNKTVEQGAKIVRGGRRNGAFYEPTILDGDFSVSGSTLLGFITLSGKKVALPLL